MTDGEELVLALRLDGRGGGEEVDWHRIRGWSPEEGTIWVHLDGAHAGTERWLRDESGLTPYVVDGLLASETRPRCEQYREGVLLMLRGVNLNPGASPEDMVSIRLWIEDDRVVSTRMRRLMAVEDMRRQLADGKGAVSSGHLVSRLATCLTERMGPVVDDLGDRVAELEDQLTDADGTSSSALREVRRELGIIRRIAISLRRYVAPQRDALNRLSQIDEPWLDDRVRGRLRETVDRVTRITEELDEIRDRCAVIHDELAHRISQGIERIMYTLTVVATIMLPLGFLTGLLGVNVGGIPGADTAWAFWAVCGLMAVVVGIEIVLLKRLKWL